ncbi:hypothetical protein OAA60_00355 [Porticoccaceae bacterium]|nr:hypothetical protein [bacterium]MDB4351863.1 hypothetical protein [Porticoccaceae bacterium]
MNYLIFVNELGPDYKGDNIYEFIFSDNINDIWGENWESKPSNGYPAPPNLDLIVKVGWLKNDNVILTTIQNSDYFSMIDAMDDVIALSWEDESGEIDFTNKKRLVFRFGDTEEMIKDKLYERDFVLEYEKKITYEK